MRLMSNLNPEDMNFLQKHAVPTIIVFIIFISTGGTLFYNGFMEQKEFYIEKITSLEKDKIDKDTKIKDLEEQLAVIEKFNYTEKTKAIKEIFKLTVKFKSNYHSVYNNVWEEEAGGEIHTYTKMLSYKEEELLNKARLSFEEIKSLIKYYKVENEFKDFIEKVNNQLNK